MNPGPERKPAAAHPLLFPEPVRALALSHRQRAPPVRPGHPPPPANFSPLSYWKRRRLLPLLNPLNPLPFIPRT
jgi:hypothetical protein